MRKHFRWVSGGPIGLALYQIFNGTMAALNGVLTVLILTGALSGYWWLNALATCTCGFFFVAYLPETRKRLGSEARKAKRMEKLEAEILERERELGFEGWPREFAERPDDGPATSGQHRYLAYLERPEAWNPKLTKKQAEEILNMRKL
jgi:hypothetical protein